MKNQEYIGELVHHTGSMQATKPKRTKRLARLIGAGGGLTGLAKGLIVMTVTAALISTMVGTYIVSQKDFISLEGRLTYDLWVDGVPIGGDSLAMEPDVFSGDNLSWGETEAFTHTFYSPPYNGNFSVVINQSWQTWLLPGHEADEFYGYRMYCLDETNNEITSFIVLTGQPAREIQFVHTLDTHFAATSNPLPYNLTLEVSEYDSMPYAINDTISAMYNIPITVDILANDYDLPMNLALRITNIPANDSNFNYLLVGAFPDQQLRITFNTPGVIDVTKAYVISNGIHEATGYLIIHGHT